MTTWPQTRLSLLARLADPADGAAWRAFEAIYQPAIYRYARSRGLQEADALEVVQEALVAVHRAIARWEPSQRAGSFRAWLAETARRTTLGVLRQRDRGDRGAGGSSVRAALEAVAAREDGDAEDERRWEFFCAAACVEQDVNEATWRAFWLTAVEGRPAAFAAQALGMTVGNVYSAKCRVLTRIRRQIEEGNAT
jgi:RNA polymerase sigma factor (sigma-70 family)